MAKKLWKMELGKQIRQCRINQGMTQFQLGKQVGCSRQMIVRYENGNDAPSLDVIGVLSEVLEADFNIAGFKLRPERTVPTKQARTAPRQMRLKFGEEHTYHGATLKIRPTAAGVVIAIATRKLV